MDITPASQVTSDNKAQTHHEYWNLLEGIHFKFPTFKHDHPPVINVNEVADERLTVGQKVADKVASGMGSWRFIIIQGCLLATWVVINTIQLFFKPFDPYPYILLNLALSFQAAFAAPFIMISQNRQSQKDRLIAENDYHTNVKGEEETRNLMDHLDHQDTVLFQLVKRIEEQHEEVLHHLARLDPELARRLGLDIQEVSEELVEEETGESNITGNS